jgi:hypothetical protein
MKKVSFSMSDRGRGEEGGSTGQSMIADKRKFLLEKTWGFFFIFLLWYGKDGVTASALVSGRRRR